MRNFNKTEEAKFVLLYACKYGEKELVEILIKKGVDVNADNDAALIEASSNSHVEVVEVLLKHGADVHAGNDKALRQASEALWALLRARGY